MSCPTNKYATQVNKAATSNNTPLVFRPSSENVGINSIANIQPSVPNPNASFRLLLNFSP